jgi:hypothetical protein
VPEEGLNGRNGWRRLSRRAQKFENAAEFANYTVARMLPKEVLHSRISGQVWMSFMRREFDTAAFQAMKAVEVAVREAADLEEYLIAYLDGAGLRGDPKGPLFRTIGSGTNRLTRTVLPQANAYAMIRRRAAAAGIARKLGNHSFRATGITAYLKNGGTLEKAAVMANHASTRTTQLYDRRRDELSLDEVERIGI